MASVAAMPTRALRPATPFARSGDVDAGRSCRGGTSDRATMFARFSNVDCKSLGSRRALATGIDRDGLASRSTPRGTTVVPRAAARDSADDPSAAAPSHAPHASSPRELWELSGRSSAATRGVGVGASPSPPPMSPTLAAGVALLGGVAFAAASRRAASRREELELQRRFRGELIRRRLRTATGGSASRAATSDREYREVDYAGDRLMSARDVAFERTRGLVRRDKTKPRPEDAAFLRDADARNRRDAAAAAAISRGDFFSGADVSPRTSAMRRPSRPADGFETDAFEPENASERSASYGTVRVTLGVTCAVAPGQTLWCVGGAPALGGWDMRASAPMDRVGADRWQCVVGVPFGPLEYRYVLATEMPETGGTRMESELGNARSRVVVSDNGPQLFVEETAPAFAPAAPPTQSPPRGAPRDAVARLARKHAVDADAAAEVLELTRGNEGAADKMLAAASRGLATRGDGARGGSSFSSAVDVAERLRGPRGGQFAAAAAAMGAPLDGDDISEVAMNDDVTVVEDFTDVSDDELARLVADLRAELDED